jgi:PPOX class probable F420-dependent enzyme
MADLALVKELARADHDLAVLAVTRGDGTVHASLVKFGILDDPLDGEPSIGIVVAGNARKLHHLRRVGHATAVVRDGWRWASVEGPVRLVGPDDSPDESVRVPEILRDVYRAAGGTHDDWEEFDRVMAEDRRCAVFVRMAKVSGNG